MASTEPATGEPSLYTLHDEESLTVGRNMPRARRRAGMCALAAEPGSPLSLGKAAADIALAAQGGAKVTVTELGRELLAKELGALGEAILRSLGEESGQQPTGENPSRTVKIPWPRSLVKIGVKSRDGRRSYNSARMPAGARLNGHDVSNAVVYPKAASPAAHGDGFATVELPAGAVVGVNFPDGRRTTAAAEQIKEAVALAVSAWKGRKTARK